MATCNDCFHHDICETKAEQLRRHGIKVIADKSNADKRCTCYLDRSRVTVAPKKRRLYESSKNRSSP